MNYRTTSDRRIRTAMMKSRERRNAARYFDELDRRGATSGRLLSPLWW